ncbi:MAG: hypothetical protein JWN18_317 [Parcubacteria group bacterium]|nr:hypothetical protein [Parcubacteria group bacterium]
MIRPNYARSPLGFTLIETVMVAALAACLMIAVGLLILMFGKISSYDRAVSLSSGSATAVMHELGSLVLPADAVISSRAFGGTTYTSSASVLVLEIPSIDSSGAVISSTYDYAVFYVSGTSAYRILSVNASSKRASGTKLLSSTINSLSFAYNNTDASQVDTVTADVQTRIQVKQDVVSDHRSGQFQLRNH